MSYIELLDLYVEESVFMLIHKQKYEKKPNVCLHKATFAKKETLMGEEIQLNTEVKLCRPEVQALMVYNTLMSQD